MTPLSRQKQQSAGNPWTERDITPSLSTSREIHQGLPQSRDSDDDGITDGELAMFNPLVEAKAHVQVLSKTQETFVNKFFTEVVSEETIDLTILDKCPIPELKSLILKKLDTDILNMIFSQAQKAVKQQDGWYITINKWIKALMGPLFHLWKLLSDARQNVGEININQVPRYV